MKTPSVGIWHRDAGLWNLGKFNRLAADLKSVTAGFLEPGS
jgi:hypothetical protein